MDWQKVRQIAHEIKMHDFCEYKLRVVRPLGAIRALNSGEYNKINIISLLLVMGNSCIGNFGVIIGNVDDYGLLFDTIRDESMDKLCDGIELLDKMSDEDLDEVRYTFRYIHHHDAYWTDEFTTFKFTDAPVFHNKYKMVAG